MKAPERGSGRLAMAMIGIWAVVAACNLAQSKKVEPSPADYRATLAIVDSNMSLLRSSALELRAWDLGPTGPKHHSQMWWDQFVGLTIDTASVTSAVRNY